MHYHRLMWIGLVACAIARSAVASVTVTLGSASAVDFGGSGCPRTLTPITLNNEVANSCGLGSYSVRVKHDVAPDGSSVLDVKIDLDATATGSKGAGIDVAISAEIEVTGGPVSYTIEPLNDVSNADGSERFSATRIDGSVFGGYCRESRPDFECATQGAGDHLVHVGTLSGTASLRIQANCSPDRGPSDSVSCFLDFEFRIRFGAGGTDDHWTNVAGGDWDVAGNWDRQQVPLSTENTFVDLGGSLLIRLPGNPLAARLVVDHTHLGVEGGGTLTGTGTGAAASLLIRNGGRLGVLQDTLNAVEGLVDTQSSISNLTIQSPGARLALSSSLHIGTSLTGTLEVGGGGVLDGNGLTIGSTVNPSLAIFSGLGPVSHTGPTVVGSPGAGQLQVLDSAQLTSGKVNIPGDGGSGTAAVKGAASAQQFSQWQMGDLTLGFSAGGVNSPGTLEVLEGGSVTARQVDLSGKLTVAGASNGASSQMTASGVTSVGGNAGAGDLVVDQGGHFIAQTELDIGAAASGTLTARGSGTLVTADTLHIGGPSVTGRTEVSDSGVIEARELGIGDLGGTGTLVVGTTGSGLPVVRAKDKLIVGNLGSGSLEINEGGLVGAGELQVGAADPNDSGSVSVNGPGNGAGFAFLGVKGPAVLSRQNAQLTISGGGSLLCQQGLQIAPSGQAQVVVTGSGSSVAVDGILLVAAASASGRATLNIAGGGTVIPEDATKRLSVIVGDSFSGPGAVTLSNVTGASKPSTMDVTSIDLTDGSMDINDHCLVQAGIVNVGQVGVATLTLAGSGVTDSLLKCQTLNVGGQGILRLCPAAKMEASVTADFAAGSQWAGGGIIDTPALHDNGLIRVGCSPGTLTVNGDFEMGETGVLEIEVGGLEPGQFDVLQVNGNATLAGRLELKFINGFVPKPGDNIDFLQVSGQITGQLSGDTIIDVPADAASGQAAAQATVTWDVTPEGTLRMTVTDVQGIDEVAQDIPAAGCGAGACGASAVSMLPFTLVGMNFMKLRRRRRYRLDR